MQTRFSVSSFSFVILIFVCAIFAEAKSPNIVFIFSDDHAVQAIGAYGSKIHKTPNIDRLANEGALFVNSFCANSICGPSRACILTGKHSHINGFRRNGERFDGSQMTFPKLLQKAGYQTALVGKWHLGTNPTGFDYWEVLPGQGSYYNPDFLQMDGSKKRYEGYCTDLISDRAIQWLDEDRDREKPFLLMCQHKAPHRNWAPAPRHLSIFDGKDLPEPASLFDDYSGRSPILKENEMTLQNHFFWKHDAKFHGDNLFPDHFRSRIRNGEYHRMTPEQKSLWDDQYEPENQEFITKMRAGEMSEKDILRWKYQRYIKDYLRTITALDENVGRVLDYLDENGLRENTIVIYSSDQGFYLGEHGWYDKRWMFEESLKMPFVIRWPGVIEPGKRSEALIQNIDYAPTFLEIAGTSVPSEIQGRSLLPLLKGDPNATSDWRDAIYYAYYENDAVHQVPIHDGIRTEKYKAIFFPRGGQWQLFDLLQDPNEMKSLHKEAAYLPILQGLQRRYRDLKKFYNANSATIPMSRGDEDWWKKRSITKDQKIKKADLLFIGDSITQGWEGTGKATWDRFYKGRNAANVGFSGDRTEHVIWRLERGNLTKIKPKVAVLMIGTNNTGHFLQEPAEVAAGIESILDLIRSQTPETKVLLLGIFPRGETQFDEKRLNNLAINQRIRRFHDGDRVHYLDISDAFLQSDGSISTDIMPDRLHLSEAGYSIWAKAMEPKLTELGL